MSYKYNETEDGREIVNPDGEVIGVVEPPYSQPFDGRITDMILEDSEFSKSQSMALKSILGRLYKIVESDR